MTEKKTLVETLKSSTGPPATPQRKRSSPKDIQVGEQRVRENGKEIYLAALDREYIIFCQIFGLFGIGQDFVNETLFHPSFFLCVLSNFVDGKSFSLLLPSQPPPTNVQ